MSTIEASNPYFKYIEFGMEQARLAGAIMIDLSGAALETEMKSDHTRVTVADKTINRNIIAAAEKTFPGLGVVGEEESTADYGMGQRLIVDPIDGTDAQVIGLNSATCSIGYVEDGKTMAAVVYEPVKDHMYIAVRGAGSFLNGKRLLVNNDTVENGIITLAPDYFTASGVNEPFIKNIFKILKGNPIMFPGAVFRSCLVANGRIAGFPHPRVKPYDIAAANLIVTEAGGMATDIYGNELDFSKNFRGAVLSNGVVHQDLLDLFK